MEAMVLVDVIVISDARTGFVNDVKLATPYAAYSRAFLCWTRKVIRTLYYNKLFAVTLVDACRLENKVTCVAHAGY
jgi:hypothetical protein